jgi:hypothetical protein
MAWIERLPHPDRSIMPGLRGCLDRCGHTRDGVGWRRIHPLVPTPVSGLDLCPEVIEDFLVLGKIPRFQLRVDQFAIQAHFKAPLIRRDELQSGEPLTKGIHDRFRQAHGLRNVVSRHTIFDGDFHALLSHHLHSLY